MSSAPTTQEKHPMVISLETKLNRHTGRAALWCTIGWGLLIIGIIANAYIGWRHGWVLEATQAVMLITMIPLLGIIVIERAEHLWNERKAKAYGEMVDTLTAGILEIYKSFKQIHPGDVVLFKLPPGCNGVGWDQYDGRIFRVVKWGEYLVQLDTGPGKPLACPSGYITKIAHVVPEAMP
jgi:hypothetical protein